METTPHSPSRRRQVYPHRLRIVREKSVRYVTDSAGFATRNRAIRFARTGARSPGTNTAKNGSRSFRRWAGRRFSGRSGTGKRKRRSSLARRREDHQARRLQLFQPGISSDVRPTRWEIVFLRSDRSGGKVALRFSGDLWQHAHGVLFSPSGPFPSQPPRSKHIRPGGEAAYVVVSAADSSDKAKSKVLPPGIEEKLSCSLTGSYHSKQRTSQLQGAQAVFGFKSQKAKLEERYRQLLDEAYQLSHTNRKKSDEKAAEADEVRRQLDNEGQA